MKPSEEDFKAWLRAREYKRITIKDYLFYYPKFTIHTLNQENVELFIRQYNNPVARAFVKIYLEYLDTPESKDIKIPKIKGRHKQKLPKVISEQDVLEIEKVMSKERDKLMLLLSFYCGLRIGELMKIGPKDFNWKKWDRDISQMGELKVYGKGNKEGLAIVPNILMARIRQWINEEEYHKIPNNDYIFSISDRRWQQILHQKGKQALDMPIHPHILRHSIASTLLPKGVDAYYIKEFLRHSNISTTQIYLHLKKDELKDKYSKAMMLSST